jgi:hypothetical protein
LQHFLSVVVMGGRDDGDASSELGQEEADERARAVQCSTLQHVETMFAALCPLSRSHCMLLDRSCRRLFGQSLEELVASKLSGSVARAVTAWTLPLHEAYAFLLKENAKNVHIVSFLVASLTKGELKMVDEAMKSRCNKSLKEVATEGLSGEWLSVIAPLWVYMYICGINGDWCRQGKVSSVGLDRARHA